MAWSKPGKQKTKRKELPVLVNLLSDEEVENFYRLLSRKLLSYTARNREIWTFRNPMKKALAETMFAVNVHLVRVLGDEVTHRNLRHFPDQSAQ